MVLAVSQSISRHCVGSLTCSRVFGPFLSEVLQGIGRVRRYGCPEDVVFVTEYHLAGELNDHEVLRILAKAAPEAMATPNREIFGTENGDISTAEIDLGDWVLCNGVATKLEDALL